MREVGDTGVTLAAPVGGGAEWVKVVKCKQCGEVLSGDNYSMSESEEEVLGGRFLSALVVGVLTTAGTGSWLYTHWLDIDESWREPVLAVIGVLVAGIAAFRVWVVMLEVLFGYAGPRELEGCDHG
jgi:hypothetical protein